MDQQHFWLLKTHSNHQRLMLNSPTQVLIKMLSEHFTQWSYTALGGIDDGCKTKSKLCGYKRSSAEWCFLHHRVTGSKCLSRNKTNWSDWWIVGKRTSVFLTHVSEWERVRVLAQMAPLLLTSHLQVMLLLQAVNGNLMVTFQPILQYSRSALFPKAL